jgi:hypothetical protein
MNRNPAGTPYDTTRGLRGIPREDDPVMMVRDYDEYCSTCLAALRAGQPCPYCTPTVVRPKLRQVQTRLCANRWCTGASGKPALIWMLSSSDLCTECQKLRVRCSAVQQKIERGHFSEWFATDDDPPPAA